MGTTEALLICRQLERYWQVLLSRLNAEIVKTILPESQCGFRQNRGTTDMIFTALQIQEKCSEHRQDLYQVFVDLTKAFDSVNRETLWKILGKLGCPDHFVKLIRSFHDEMEVSVNVGGTLTDPFKVETGVKQGDLIAPTLFSVFFSIVLNDAFRDCNQGIYIRYRSSGKLFNIRRFAAKTEVLLALVRDLLYADDCDLVAHTESDMQCFMDRLSEACKAFGLTISLDKTVVMFQPAPGTVYVEPSIYTDGKKLKVVDKFTYLGSTINRFCSLDDEIALRLKKATGAFSALKHRVWSQRGLKKSTKLEVYNACVLTCLLYSCETWVVYRRHLKQLERFHQRCLRSILGVHWTTHTPDTEVLEKANTISIEAHIHRHRLRWVGHVIRLDDDRIPKQLLYGELSVGSRPQHKPKKRFKDCVKDSLALCKIDNPDWEMVACDRNRWRKMVYSGSRCFQDNANIWAKTKRAAKKGDNIDPDLSQFVCKECGRVCLSSAGLTSHRRSHAERPLANYEAFLGINQLACEECGKVCKSRSGLARHLKIHQAPGSGEHKGKAQPKDFVCCVCGRVCKSLAGFKSHCRSHDRR